MAPTIKERILNLQTELELIKGVIIAKPDFDIDEKNWQKLKPLLKKIRKRLYKSYYERK